MVELDSSIPPAPQPDSAPSSPVEEPAGPQVGGDGFFDNAFAAVAEAEEAEAWSPKHHRNDGIVYDDSSIEDLLALVTPHIHRSMRQSNPELADAIKNVRSRARRLTLPRLTTIKENEGHRYDA